MAEHGHATARPKLSIVAYIQTSGQIWYQKSAWVGKREFTNKKSASRFKAERLVSRKEQISFDSLSGNDSFKDGVLDVS